MLDLPRPGPRLDATYWERDVEKFKEYPTLEPLKRPCGDCAGVSMYGELSKSLRQLKPELREAVLRTWDCHNAHARGCAGARKVANGEQEPVP